MTAAATGLRAVLWAIALALGLLLLSSLVRQPLTWPQSAALAAFGLLAALRPADALLLFAAFGPIAGVLGAVFDLPFGGTRLLEALVLVLLVPWLAAQVRWLRSARWRPLDWALVAFAAVVTASAAAHLQAIALSLGEESVSRTLWEHFSTTYFDHPPVFDVISQSMLLLEGIGLCAMASRVAADPLRARGVAAMAVAGAAAAAVMNVYRLFEIALRRGPLTETLAETFTTLRINTQFSDVNAAGSYFALAVVGRKILAADEIRESIAQRGRERRQAFRGVDGRVALQRRVGD